MKSKKIRRAVFIVTYAIVDGKSHYLILKRHKHWTGWEFPKGGIERWEARRLTIKRELREETGLPPMKIRSFPVKGQYQYKKGCEDRPGIAGQTYKLYAVEVKKDRVKIDKREHSDYKWVSFQEALKKLTWPNQKKCLGIVELWLKRN